MESGHLLTRSGLTYVEVSSEVCHDSFCQLGNTVSLSWIVCREAFCLHVLSSSSCIPVVCLEPVLFLIPLQCVNLFCNSILLIYFISAAVILLASLALIVHVSLPYNTTLTLQLLCDISFAYIYFFHFDRRWLTLKPKYVDALQNKLIFFLLIRCVIVLKHNGRSDIETIQITSTEQQRHGVTSHVSQYSDAH